MTGYGPPGPQCGEFDFWLDVGSGNVWACGPVTAAANGAGRSAVVAMV
jgi:hypothetical protein